MTRNEAKKRLTKIKGIPLKPSIGPRDEGRKGFSKVEYVNEYESEFDNFFDFEEDLSDMEAARKQVERIEEQKILYAHRQKSLGLDSEPDGDSDSFLVINDEADDEDKF